MMENSGISSATSSKSRRMEGNQDRSRDREGSGKKKQRECGGVFRENERKTKRKRRKNSRKMEERFYK